MGVVCEATALGCCEESPEDEGVSVMLASPEEVGVAVISVVVAGPVDNDCDTAPVSVETDVSEVDCVNCRRRGVCITGREGIYMKYE